VNVRQLVEKSNPFGALLGVSSFIAAILYVAGFSFRWSYYYNFGVQHLIFQLPFQSFLITAIELVREPANMVLVFFFIILPVILVNGLISTVRRLSQTARSLYVGKPATIITRLFGLDSSLVIDGLRAFLIIYTTFMVSSHIGYTTFIRHTADSPHNPLPRVTLVFGGQEGDLSLPLICGSSGGPLQVIGDAQKIREIQETHLTCSGKMVTWRLLYRDDNTICLFASEPKQVIKGRRPLTLVVPQNKSTVMVIN
jgi:hypothetical protein